jgi:hypothetical protein
VMIMMVMRSPRPSLKKACLDVNGKYLDLEQSAVPGDMGPFQKKLNEGGIAANRAE